MSFRPSARIAGSCTLFRTNFGESEYHVRRLLASASPTAASWRLGTRWSRAALAYTPRSFSRLHIMSLYCGHFLAMKNNQRGYANTWRVAMKARFSSKGCVLGTAPLKPFSARFCLSAINTTPTRRRAVRLLASTALTILLTLVWWCY
jgi:hypothetical protein